MTFFYIPLSKLVLPVAAIGVAVFGLAAGSNAHSSDDHAEPVTCEISVSKGRYGHTYEGIVHAETAAKGTYKLSLSKRGSGGSAMINQSGDFNVAAGGSESLGQATFGGLPSAVNAKLTLSMKGKTLTCDNSVTDL